jgi:hypothetical protein
VAETVTTTPRARATAVIFIFTITRFKGEKTFRILSQQLFLYVVHKYCQASTFPDLVGSQRAEFSLKRLRKFIIPTVLLFTINGLYVCRHVSLHHSPLLTSFWAKVYFKEKTNTLICTLVGFGLKSHSHQKSRSGLRLPSIVFFSNDCNSQNGFSPNLGFII